jgi:menaquinone-9 beta-reductase
VFGDGGREEPGGSTRRPGPAVWPEQVDILVVGAGPAGSAAAIALARAGRSVLVVDKATFPRDKCCGDGLTTGALRRLEQLGLDPTKVPSWQWVDDVMIGSPNRRTVEFPLPGSGHFAAVATRLDLDAALVALARNAGAQILQGVTVTSVAQYRTEVHVTLDGAHTVAARQVIAADGMWSAVRKMLSPVGSSASPRAAEARPYLGEWHAMRQYFSGVSTPESKKLWVWFEPDLAPGYVWCFPVAGNRVNFGFGIERRGGTRTRTMKAQWESIIQRPHIAAVLGPNPVAEDSPKAWPIPADPTTASLTDGRILYVGDAARVCDALTGEGIGQALQTGILAAEALIASPTDPYAAARQYEADAQAELVPDHRMASTLSKMLRSPWICNAAVAICGSTGWTRRNFVRWLFEDYARGIALTPSRWRWGLMSGDGSYRNL